MKTRTKTHAVKVTHEDRRAIRRWPGELTADQAEAAGVMRAALRQAQSAFGPGQQSIQVLAASLPRQWVGNAVKAVEA